MTSTVYLERALIGSLLMYPERLDQAAHLTHTDFTDPTCHLTWKVLGQLRLADPGPLNVVDLAEKLGTAHPQMHPEIRSPAAIAELQAAAPYRPHIDAYAALIVDATIRREALTLGRRIAQLSPTDPEQLGVATADAHARLAHLAQRLGDAGPQACALTPTRHGHDHAMSRRTPSTRQPSPTWAELSVLAAAIHDHPPGARDHVLASIQASQLHSHPVRAAWTAVESLRPSTLPIDEITTYWQLSHAPAGRVPLGLDRLRSIRNFGLLADAAITDLQLNALARAQGAMEHLVNSPALTERSTSRLIDDISSAVDKIQSTPRHPSPSAR